MRSRAVSGTVAGGSWNRDGTILVGNPLGGVLQCPSSGGRAIAVTLVGPSDGELHIFPSFLSDGRHFIYLRISRTSSEQSGIYLSELNAAASGIGRRLITTGFAGAYVPAAEGRSGAIVFGRDGAPIAQQFDEQRLVLTGEPVQLADRIGSYLEFPYFSVSPTMLVYRAPHPPLQLAWFDRQGRELGRVGPPERIVGSRSPPTALGRSSPHMHRGTRSTRTSGCRI